MLDPGVARSLAELLDAELISVRMLPESGAPEAFQTWTVFVPQEQLEAVRDLLTRSQLTDSELSFLATGKLGGSKDSE